MKPLPIFGALALSLVVAACGESGTTARNSSAPAVTNSAANAAQQAYSATGTVTAIAGDQVTISHGPVEGLGWPAMTMTFRTPSPRMIEGIGVGDSVAFQFREVGGIHELTSLSKR